MNAGKQGDIDMMAALLDVVPMLMRADVGHDPDALLLRALQAAATPDEVVQVARAALDFGARGAAGAAMGRLAGYPEMAGAQAELAARAAHMWDIADLPHRDAPLPDAIPGRIACVLYSSLPYLSTGYAIRSQALARALARGGADVHCVTRPGFPWDERPDILRHPAPDIAAGPENIDGVPYHRLPAPTLDNWQAYPSYVSAATEALTQHLRDLRPSVVMAASSHACALPALRAARILGLPMVYDMRGMWELSRAAREPDFMASPQFCYERALETVVARGADHVFALSPPMRAAMIRRGVAPDRITYLPNGCDPARIAPAGRGAALRRQLQIPQDTPVIGYAGSFPAYEGLEDLIAAAARLKERGHRFALVLAGDEDGTGLHGLPRGQILRNLAQTLDVADRLILTGRIDRDAVPDLLDMFDIMVVPRRSMPVTETVAPLKPAEAMAAGRAVVVSSVGGMSGLIEDGQTGLVFEAGNIAALADTIARLLQDGALRARLGQNARRAATAGFTWDSIAARMQDVLTPLPQTPDLPRNLD